MRIVRFSPTDNIVKPSKSSVNKPGTNIWFVFDDDERLHPLAREATTIRSKQLAVAINSSMSADHPLRGKRIIEPTPSGFPGDLELTPDGSLVVHVNGEVVPYKKIGEYNENL